MGNTGVEGISEQRWKRLFLRQNNEITLSLIYEGKNRVVDKGLEIIKFGLREN